MARLPTAHSSQAFGRRHVDFYAAPGQVIGADPRARSDERRIEDSDGERHDVRLADPRYGLEPGDFASVLRLQPGPRRRSRPVAVVRHDAGDWGRTQPEAHALLSRAGVSRNVNWALALLTLLAAIAALAHPMVFGFAAELAPAALPAVSGIDVIGLALAQAPGLEAARFSAQAPELAAGLAAISPALAPWLDLIAYAGVSAGLAVTAYAARSWRLIWLPLFIAFAGVGAIGLAGGAAGAAEPALAALGGALALFLVGGAVNRWRDAARLEARIAVLADHLLRHPPEEYVSAPRARPAEDAAAEEPAVEEPAPAAEPAVAAPANDRAVAAAAAAAAVEPADPDAAPEPVVEPTAAPTAETTGDALPETMAAGAETAEGGAADPAEDVAAEAPEDATVTAEAPEPAAQAAPDAEAEVEDADAETEAEIEAKAETDAAEAEADDAPEADGAPEADPRAARAINLPPPPPMPAPRAAARGREGEASDPARETAMNRAAPPPPAPVRTPTTPVSPARPLPDNVVPIFAAAPPRPRRAETPETEPTS